MLTFASWLTETLALQRRAFDINPPGLVAGEFAEYWRWNVLAAIDELTEALNTVQWKPWAKNPGEVFDLEDAVEEIVDVMHFLGNMLCALGVSGEELSSAYERKLKVNEERQLSGYTHRNAT